MATQPSTITGRLRAIALQWPSHRAMARPSGPLGEWTRDRHQTVIIVAALGLGLAHVRNGRLMDGPAHPQSKPQ